VEALDAPRFGLEAIPERSRAVLRISGELDMASSPRMADAVRELWSTGWTAVGLDFADVAFVDSTGLGTLLSLLHDARDDARDLTVSRSCPALDRLIALSRLEQHVPRG
jgi:anti-sigma B factor antagonist